MQIIVFQIEISLLIDEGSYFDGKMLIWNFSIILQGNLPSMRISDRSDIVVTLYRPTQTYQV